MKFVILIFIWGLVPLLMGERISNNKNNNILFIYCIGMFSELTIFHYIYLLFLSFDQPFHRLCYIYFGVLILISVVLLLTRKLQLKKMLYEIVKEIRQWPWYIIIVILLVLLQCYFKATTMTRMALDDSELVVCAVDAVYSDKMWYINPSTGVEGWKEFTIISKRWPTSWIMYYAFVGKITGISVATVAHTVLPMLIIPMANMIYTLLGLSFFENDRKKTSIFLLFLNWILINGWTNRDNMARTLLIYSWHGRTLLYAIALPFMLYFVIRLMNKDEVTWHDSVIAFIIITVAVSASIMGVLFLCILLPMIFMCYYKKYKKSIVSMRQAIFVAFPLLISGMIYLYGRYIWNPF